MSVTVIGMTALQRRLAAISGPNVMQQWHSLVGNQAIAEQGDAHRAISERM